MNSLQIFGLEPVLIGGIVLFILITFQLLTGLRILKTNPKHHRLIGIAIFIFVVIHATLGIIYIYGG